MVRALLRVRAAEEDVRAAADQWEATFDAITDAVCVISANGERIRCNEAADELVALLHAGQGQWKFHELFPGLTADINGLFNRMLPDAGPTGTGARLGKQSSSKWAPSWLTTLNDRAARENNEVG